MRMPSKMFYDSTYGNYQYSINTSPEGVKRVDVRDRHNNLLIGYGDIETYSEAEGIAQAFIDGLTHQLKKGEEYTCPECGFTSTIEEIARLRKPCCNSSAVYDS